MADKLLEIKGVSKIFRVGGMIRGKKLVAVDDVTLSIDNDKPVILSVVGESGCGKSTLCKMVLRLHNPDMGDIVLDGQSYRDKKSYNAKQFKLEVQPIFQNPYESFSARKPVDSYLFNTALRLGIAKNKAEATNLVDDALKSVGLSLAVVKGKYPTQFSGGELQRVSIARALITRPKLIIADEPTTALDVSVQAQIIELLKKLCEENGTAVILVTHDMGVIAETADRVAVMYAGRLAEIGPVEEMIHDAEHPYTIGLMGSIPKIGDEQDRLSQIPGAMPHLTEVPSGCAFHPRCPLAEERCIRERPGLQPCGNKLVACWKAGRQNKRMQFPQEPFTIRAPEDMPR